MPRVQFHDAALGHSELMENSLQCRTLLTHEHTFKDRVPSSQGRWVDSGPVGSCTLDAWDTIELFATIQLKKRADKPSWASIH